MSDLPTPPTWDLSDLYSGLEDPAIDAALERVQSRAQAFEERYRPRLADPGLSAETVLATIREYESISQEGAKPADYAHLMHSTDTADPRRGALLQRVQETLSRASLHLLFFDLELVKMPAERADPLLANPLLAPYRHYFKVVRAFAGHDLSEPEERILEEKANTSQRAFARLFDEMTSGLKFPVERDGERSDATQAEVLSMMFSPDRSLRRAAAAALSAGLASQSHALTFIFNTLLQDKAIEDRLRRFAEPEDSRHLANELDAETVETVMRTCEERYDLVARYYRMKREILGYDRLTHYDRYAPLFDTKEEVPYPEATRLVLDAFGDFSPRMREIAAEFFDRGWVDALPRPGKEGGAYCSYVTPDLHPYLFANYMNRMEDVMTLAHEMGHGIHAYLSREQSYFNFHGTLPLAELASTFGEMLVFEKVQASATPQDRLALYGGKIEGTFATIFRQATMYRFEQRVHRARREQGELSADAIGEIWHSQMKSMFGDSVELGDEHRAWWSYISHFTAAPFYVYAYSFGELLVLSLFEMSRQQGPGFEERYVNLLRQGGSRSPHELMHQMEIDLTDAEFWRGGMRVLEGLIDQFERLVHETGAISAGGAQPAKETAARGE